MTFETSDQENNDKEDNKDNDNEDNDNEDNNNKDNDNEDYNNNHDHDEYRGPNCNVRAVSQCFFMYSICLHLVIVILVTRHNIS